MRASFAAAALALATTVNAGIFITSPVASTSCTAGQPCKVSWNDDGQSPALAAIGPCEIGLYTGNAQQQTKLQDIQTMDVSTNSEVQFLPDANVGPNGNMYFIRFQSIGLKDTANPQFPYQSFSAKFTLSGMTGTFSPAIQAQLDGITSASGAASTPASTPTSAAGSSSAASSAVKMTTSVSAAATPKASATTSASNSTSGAVSTVVPVVSSIAGVTAAMGVASVLLGMVAFGL